MESCWKNFQVREGPNKNSRASIVKQVIQALIIISLRKWNANEFNEYVLCVMFLNRISYRVVGTLFITKVTFSYLR